MTDLKTLKKARRIYACEMNCDECPYDEPVDCSDAKKIENSRVIF